MPVIPVTQETVIERITVQTSPGKMLARSHLNKELGMMAHTCHPSSAGGISRPAWGKR
jgi:hypothetical protein